ncbi:ALK and LTK ligand 1-like [Cheilinus undulatus]|uniref:ALK and LTK ligand 1-like n=1 Tax=Cheilinus undulatus TaxID=241271 RepID=UPI001BD55950|nr:ALK and LTK ligand 1-like [Cheilinus undulatus]
MQLPRLPILSVLLVLLLAAGPCMAAALLKGDGRSMLDLVGRYPRTRPESGLVGHGVKIPERERTSQHRPESQHRDSQHKDKFIIHLTGPLYINPRCKKHFNRLYYNTRDCTVPAYYKRCARLLTRLANSPRCSKR